MTGLTRPRGGDTTDSRRAASLACGSMSTVRGGQQAAELGGGVKSHEKVTSLFTASPYSRGRDAIKRESYQHLKSTDVEKHRALGLHSAVL